MNRRTVLQVLVLVLVVLALGCSKGGNTPLTPNDLTANKATTGTPSQTHLWGYYDVYVDIPTKTATAVPNRNVMFAANVVQFLNGKASNLGFKINGTPVGSNYVDVDIDVSITHPFAGAPAYNGYDVRGIFLGNGSKSLMYNSKLKYAAKDKGTLVDQQMYDYNLTTADPHTGLIGMPDGYTRWWNPTEFTTPGLFGYTPGLVGSAGYVGTALINPYKYFGDNLAVDGDLWTYLTTKTPLLAVFSSGSTNTRNYYLRFPNPTPGIKFQYAVVANWISETQHPAHGPEVGGIKVAVTPDVYYTSPTVNGGKLKLDISLPTTWNSAPSTMYVESNVLSAAYQLSTGEMIPAGGGAGYSTYHTEIPTTNVTGDSTTVNSEFWVIPVYNNYDYTNTFGVTNGAGTDKLAAFFRYDLFVSSVAYNKPPVAIFNIVTSMPASGFSPLPVQFDASGSYDPDPGDTITYAWDFNGDGVYGGATDTYTGTAVNPTHSYTASYTGNVNLKVTDNHGASTIATKTVNVTVAPSKNITLRSGVTPRTSVSITAMPTL